MLRDIEFEFQPQQKKTIDEGNENRLSAIEAYKQECMPVVG
ncbi:MAG: hypothetical protein ABIL62_01780 [Planctomycetota bacterium]